MLIQSRVLENYDTIGIIGYSLQAAINLLLLTRLQAGSGDDVTPLYPAPR